MRSEPYGLISGALGDHLMTNSAGLWAYRGADSLCKSLREDGSLVPGREDSIYNNLTQKDANSFHESTDPEVNVVDFRVQTESFEIHGTWKSVY